MDTLLAPIISPPVNANSLSSDVSDPGGGGSASAAAAQLMAESAADVPLEPGEILDTPGISNSLFNFPPSSKSNSSSSSSNPPRQSTSSLSVGSMLGSGV